MPLGTALELVTRVDDKFGNLDAAVANKLDPPLAGGMFDPTLIDLSVGQVGYQNYTQIAEIELALDPAKTPVLGGSVEVNITGGGFALTFAGPFTGLDGFVSGIILSDGVDYTFLFRFAENWAEVAPSVFEDRVLVVASGLRLGNAGLFDPTAVNLTGALEYLPYTQAGPIAFALADLTEVPGSYVFVEFTGVEDPGNPGNPYPITWSADFAEIQGTDLTADDYAGFIGSRRLVILWSAAQGKALVALSGEVGAGGSMTAAEILATLITNPAPLEGLDADLLDGQHASAFALAGNIGIDSVVADDSPQLGGPLDVNGQPIVTSAGSSANVNITPDGTGDVLLNADDVLIEEDLIHIGDTDTKFQFDAAGDLVRINTGGSERIDFSNSGVRLGAANARVTTILDEDAMTSNSATALATQQSIKAYVDANAGSGGGISGRVNGGTTGVTAVTIGETHRGKIVVNNPTAAGAQIDITFPALTAPNFPNGLTPGPFCWVIAQNTAFPIQLISTLFRSRPLGISGWTDDTQSLWVGHSLDSQDYAVIEASIMELVDGSLRWLINGPVRATSGADQNFLGLATAQPIQAATLSAGAVTCDLALGSKFAVTIGANWNAASPLLGTNLPSAGYARTIELVATISGTRTVDLSTLPWLGPEPSLLTATGDVIVLSATWEGTSLVDVVGANRA